MADEYIDKVEVGAKIQMMYIRREMDYGGENDFCRGMRKALRVIENMPVANVQPVKHGQWIAENQDKRGYADCFTCSNCNNYTYTYTLMKVCEHDYCPNCGARMGGNSE